MTKNKSTPIILLASALLWVGSTEAQVSVNTTSGNAAGNGGSAIYSIGQMVYTTHITSNGSVAQGIQQPYEIFTIGFNESKLSISLSAFPNPVSNLLNLTVIDFQQSTMHYQLYDIQSKLINCGQITEQLTKINMANLPAATYFLQLVNQENKTIKSFKIIKH
jgi:hypothetical protein